MLWLQEKSLTPAVAVELLNRFNLGDFPDAYLLTVDGIIEYFMSQLAAKKVGAEHIGVID